jgi:hypothetical protein
MIIANDMNPLCNTQYGEAQTTYVRVNMKWDQKSSQLEALHWRQGKH